MLSSESRAEIERAEIAELQRILAARTVVSQLDRLASELGVRLTILKGAVAAVQHSRQPVDLGDVDVLVSTEDASTTWNWLIRAGWRPTVEVAVSFSEMVASRRFIALSSPGAGLPLDFHVSFGSHGEISSAKAAGRRPLVGFSALDKLTGCTAFLALLAHAVIKHPYRRDHLRDIILLSEELRELKPEEVQALFVECDTHRYGPELREMLEQVAAFRDGDRLKVSTRSLPFLTWKYAAALGEHVRFDRFLPGWSAISFFALEQPGIRRIAYRTLLNEAVHSRPEDTRIRAARFRYRAPSWAVRTMRICYRVFLTLVLSATGWVMRSRIERVLSTPE
jgi:hypothetical protein